MANTRTVKTTKTIYRMMKPVLESPTVRGAPQVESKAARISGASNAHESQFMDADEADEREQINNQRVGNAKFVRPFHEQQL
jgi:hypothetical protein